MSKQGPPFEGPPFEARPWLSHPFGVVRAVAIPEEAPTPEVVARLLPEEQAFAASLPAPRLGSWVAGRLALAAALAEVGAPRTALLSTPRGAPAVPAGFVGSVSHKRRVAAAIAARDEGAGLGFDVEELAPHRYDISGRILTAEELEAVDALEAAGRWRGVLVRFSIKESIYKAVDPFVGRYVGFKEAVVTLGQPGEAAARLSMEKGEGPFAVEATWAEVESYVVSAARVRLAV